MSFTLSILAAFGAMFCWAFGDFFIQRTARKVGDIEALAIIGIVGTIGLLPLALKDITLLSSLPNLVLILTLGAITFVAALFNFEALKKGKLCVVEMVLEIELPVTIILGILFFGERLSLMQFGIVMLVFFGIFLIALKSFSSKRAKGAIEKGVALGAIAAIGMGAVNFLTAASSKSISPLMAVWAPWFVFTLMCLLAIWKREGLGKFLKDAQRHKTLALSMGIFDTLAWLLFAIAVIKSQLAVTIAITEAYPAVALFLGLWLNKERIQAHQFAGAGIALAASFALGFLV